MKLRLGVFLTLIWHCVTYQTDENGIPVFTSKAEMIETMNEVTAEDANQMKTIIVLACE